MAQNLTLEDRVADLEKQVQRLNQENFQSRSKPGWVEKIIGSMANDPDFAEILKRGQEIRQNQHGD